jgi:uncharacterized membrane protein YkgB
LFLGFWNKRLGVLGAAGSAGTFVATVTIIPFFPNGWEEAAGGFPALTMITGFLLKDVVLLAVSLYLLKQDLARAKLFTLDRWLANRRAANMGGPDRAGISEGPI